MNILLSKVDTVLYEIGLFLETLYLPSKDEYVTAAYTACHDVRAAIASSWNLTYLTFRPIFVLLSIIGEYLVVLLKILAQHSIAHGWVALREGYFQLLTASNWFIRFQRGLPTTVRYAELAVLSILVVLWMLRRRFQKYSYGERVLNWYTSKKEGALNWYEEFVNRLAETSLLMASLLPHAIYILLIMGMKRLMPSVMSYLATRTYLISIISIWHPLYQTFCVVGQINHNITSLFDEDGSRELKKHPKKTSEITREQKNKEQLHEQNKLGIDLLKYWVVYAILLAISVTLKRIPFIKSFLPADKTVKQTKSWGLFGSKAVKSGFLSRLKISATFVEEVKLVFFTWLLLMPQSFVKTNEGTRKKSKSNVPLDILYNALSPTVLSTMKSSAILSGKVEGSSYGVKTIQLLHSIFGVLVMARILSAKWKNIIIQTILESTALLPASITLLMPGYFTSYGVMYVSLVVPAGYSIQAINKAEKSGLSLDALVSTTDDISRYLQFWVVSVPVSTLICWFEPVLAWIPFSTHTTWLLWAFIQINSSTRTIYNLIEDELMAYGLLKSHNMVSANQDLKKTLLFTSIGKIIAALPSNVEIEVNEKSKRVNSIDISHEKQE